MQPQDLATPIPVSAVMICADEVPLIERCLESLETLQEVCIYFNGSDPAAFRRRLEPFRNVSIHEGAFLGFGPSKQRAVELARCDWVLSIDSDEWLDATLVRALHQQSFTNPAQAFEVLRKNRFMGVHVARGGWGNDRLLRLFHRSQARFNDKAVHEKVEPVGRLDVQPLDGTLWHEAVTDVDQFLHKISRYSTLNARSRGKAMHPFLALLRAQFAFFRSYILQLGILAGWRGLVIAYARGVGTFFKYVKRYAQARDQSD